MCLHVSKIVDIVFEIVTSGIIDADIADIPILRKDFKYFTPILPSNITTVLDIR